MSFIARIGRTWHPLARLNFLITSFFVLAESIAILSILLIPGAIDTRLASVLLALGWVWWITAFFSTAWVSWNASSLAWRALRRQDVETRNLVVAWLGPIIMIALMFLWEPLLGGVTAYRINLDFERSRDDFLIICDRIMEEGLTSPEIRDGAELGVFSKVDILYQDDVVYFELGDDLRAYGYVCVPEAMSLPSRDDVYEYDRIDDRFYAFSEIENRLTPQPETPLPEPTLDEITE